MIAAAISPETARQIGDTLAENGRVLATLDDWRAILFVAVLLIVGLGLTVFTLLRANRHERLDIAAERERIWMVAAKFGEAAGSLTTEVQVTRALNARVETALGRCEQLLERPPTDGKRR